MRNLYKEGAISKQALDKAELALEVAKTDLANARESTDLVATHAGVVTSVLVKEGEMANAYAPLMWIARTDSVRVTFEAGSRQAMVAAGGAEGGLELDDERRFGNGRRRARSISSADPESHLVQG